MANDVIYPDSLDISVDPEDLAWDHAMDISGSIYTRLKELGLKQSDLAERLGVSAGRVSQIIKGDPGMSLKTIAKIESALDFSLDGGFHYKARVDFAFCGSDSKWRSSAQFSSSRKSWSKRPSIRQTEPRSNVISDELLLMQEAA